VLGSMLAAVYSNALSSVPGVSAAEMGAAGESLGRAVDVAAGLPVAVGAVLVAEAQEAFVTGLHLVLLASIVLLAASALLSALVLRGRTSAERESQLGLGSEV
jgi:DHA2 family multidrug resistance protein-like MFS transporter